VTREEAYGYWQEKVNPDIFIHVKWPNRDGTWYAEQISCKNINLIYGDGDERWTPDAFPDHVLKKCFTKSIAEREK